jgi:hypothetical protein
VAVTHRKESDVPVICPPLYFAMGGRRNTTGRMHFAARDDMFVPGFFAGFPPDLPLRARRLLYRVGIGKWLPRVNVFPISAAPAEGAAAAPSARSPSSSRGLPRRLNGPPRAGSTPARGEIVHGVYADLLWHPLSPEDTPGLEEFWSGRAAQAAGDFRTLVDIVRDGNVLIVFPEGRPSPDGEIGPIKPGIGALVRRGKPRAVRPLALAYTRSFAGAPRRSRPRRARRAADETSKACFAPCG